MVRSSWRTGAEGFTLVELMVTIAIIGIAMAIAVPSLRALMDNQKMRTATFDLVTSVMQARSEAMKFGTAGSGIALSPASGTATGAALYENGWCVLFLTAAPTATLNPDCNMTNPGKTVVRLNSATPNVRYTVTTCADPNNAAISTSNCVVVFNASGRLRSGQAVRIQVDNDLVSSPMSRCVTIDAGGNANTMVATCP